MKEDIKNMVFRRLSLFVFFILSLFHAKAQFYTSEDEPSSVKWFKVNTPHFSILYPEGLDSLSKVYGNLLEKYRLSESLTSGYIPGGKYKRRTPVVMRAFTGISNGLVSWAPKRMEFFTLPSSDGKEASPWDKNLVIHESRHLAQMQLGYDRKLKPFTWIFGEIAVGAAAAIYPGPHLLEGDAVVAETALTRYGRGRSAGFLSYYMSAFDKGDYRNWYRWRYGSFKKYAPDHYSLGYMTLAGSRYFYEDPLFMSKYFNKVSRRPLRFFNMQKGIKSVSGLSFRKSFRGIMEGFKDMWEEEAVLRAPFIEDEKITGKSSFYVSYENPVVAGNKLFAIKSGHAEPRTLVIIEADGSETKLRPFSAVSGRMDYSVSLARLYWSEPLRDMRWGMKMSSLIRYMDLKGKKTKVRNLTKEGRLYNPAVSKNGKYVAAIDFPVKGGSALVILDAQNGRLEDRLRAPDSLQFTQAAWVQGGLIVSGISNNGAGLYKAVVENNKIKKLLEILAPAPVSIRELRSFKGGLLFTSDRTGVDEIYHFSENGLIQLTSTRYGASDACFNEAEDTIYFSSLKSEGRHIYKAADSELLYKGVVFSDIHKYRVADSLTAQEKRLAKEKGLEWPDDKEVEETSFSQPVRYRKFPGIFHIHSWLPFYTAYDDFSALNFDFNYNPFKVGALAFFQNLLGTAYGSVGYAYNYEPDEKKGNHSAHLKLTYTGLYPVFELGVDINDRQALQYIRELQVYKGKSALSISGQESKYPHFAASLNTYLPLKFSSGGVSKGITPRLRYSFNNDIYNKSYVVSKFFEKGKGEFEKSFYSYHKDKNVFIQLLETSLSAYIMRSSAKSLEYPRLGIGGSVGFNTMLSMSDIYSSSLYSYIYAYLPGFYKTQGMKISVLYQHLLKSQIILPYNYNVIVPRGFSSLSVSSFLGQTSRDQIKFTADFPMPFSVGDISFLSPVTYITHFVFSPHLDYTMFSIDNKFMAGGLMTVGANFVAKASHFMWSPFEFEFGVEVDWKTGPSFERFASFHKNGPEGTPVERFYIGPVFRTSF